MREPTIRWALVTGASEGIGAAIARRLRLAGFGVVLAGRSADKLARFTAELGDHPLLHPLVLDVADAQSVAAGLLALGRDRISIDVLVNNAGLVVPPAAFGPGTIPALEASLAANLFGAARLCEGLVPGMRQRGWGRIVNTASTAGLYGPPGLLPYSVGKAALVAYGKALAVELAPFGITVNSICPGPIATAGYRAAKGEAAMAERARPIPSGRLGAPEDAAELAAFLVSEGAAHLTGQAISLDGGEDAAGPYVAMLMQKRPARGART